MKVREDRLLCAYILIYLLPFFIEKSKIVWYSILILYHGN